MKHLLYLLLAGSLLTEQPLYGAPKKNKKKSRKVKKKTGPKGSAKTSASGISPSTPTISTPTAPTPAQTIKTEATMTKQKAQKLMEAYLEKYRKDVFLPMTDIMSKIKLISQGEKLQALVKQRSDEFLNNNDIDKKINTLMTIFDDKNAINIQTSNNLKNEFKTIAEELKKDLPEKIKANKTEEQKVIKELESQISDKFEKVLNKSKSDGKSLNEEIVKIKKEKEAIEKNYPQIIQTILNIHSAVLSLIENDILKGFFGEISKEESAKKSSEKKKAYYDAKETRYKDKIQEKKNKQHEENEKINKELEEKIKSEQDPKKKEELKRELNRRKTKKAPLKYGEKSKETGKEINKEDTIEELKAFHRSDAMQKINTLKNKNEKKEVNLLDMEIQPTTVSQKAENEETSHKELLEVVFNNNITNKTNNKNNEEEILKKIQEATSTEALKKNMKNLLESTGLIKEGSQINSEKSKKELITSLQELEKKHIGSALKKKSPYSISINNLIEAIEKFDTNASKEEKNTAHKNIYKVFDRIENQSGKSFLTKRK